MRWMLKIRRKGMRADSIQVEDQRVIGKAGIVGGTLLNRKVMNGTKEYQVTTLLKKLKFAIDTEVLSKEEEEEERDDEEKEDEKEWKEEEEEEEEDNEDLWLNDHRERVWKIFFPWRQITSVLGCLESLKSIKSKQRPHQSSQHR